MRLDEKLYLDRTAKITPCAVVRCSIEAGLQPVPARLAPVDARLALLHEEAHLGLQLTSCLSQQWVLCSGLCLATRV